MKNIEKAEELQNINKFSMRSCWECNPSHKHLKEVGGLFTCFDCGRWYMNGDYFDNEEHCNSEFKEKLLIQRVVVSKDTLCECGNTKPHREQSHCQKCINEAFTS